MLFQFAKRVKNMTRETKLGLVVSCSFLCLLGVVVGLKMTERPEDENGTPAAPDAVTQASPEPPHFPDSVKNAPILLTGAKGDPPTSSTTQKTTPGTGAGVKTQANQHPEPGSSSLPSLPGPASRQQTSKENGKGTEASTKKEEKQQTDPILPPPVSAPPVQVVEEVERLDFAPKEEIAVKETVATPSPRKEPEKSPLKGDTTLKTAQNSGLPDLPPATNPVSSLDPAAGTSGTAALPSRSGSNGGSSTLPPRNGGFGTQSTGKTEDSDIPPLPAVSERGSGTGKTTGTTTGTGSADDHLPPIAAVVGAKPVPVTDPVKEKTEGSKIAPDNQSLPTIDPSSISIAEEKKPEGTPITAVPPSRRLEPIPVGVAPTASVPAFSTPTVSVAPKVRAVQANVVVYTEESYVARTGDSYRSISLAKFQTDKYANALSRFNYSHPLADENLPADGSLSAGQKVYIPPKEILDKRYPELVGSAAPGVSVLAPVH
jgi:hypothetical protein